MTWKRAKRVCLNTFLDNIRFKLGLKDANMNPAQIS